jgi:hypothetical protein
MVSCDGLSRDGSACDVMRLGLRLLEEREARVPVRVVGSLLRGWILAEAEGLGALEGILDCQLDDGRASFLGECYLSAPFSKRMAAGGMRWTILRGWVPFPLAGGVHRKVP